MKEKKLVYLARADILQLSHQATVDVQVATKVCGKNIKYQKLYYKERHICVFVS